MPVRRSSRTRSPGRSGSAPSRRSGSSEGRCAPACPGDLLEEGQGVERAGRGLRMELDAGEVLAGQPFHGPVVERQMGDELGVGGGDRVPVVLDGHEDATRAQVANGVVGAAVAEVELERLQAEGEAEQLVAEADPEQRYAPQEPADRLDRALED